MGFYKLIYNIFSYPFGWLIFLFYTIFQKNYLAAVIVLAVLVKLVLLPTSINQQKSQAKTKRMQARINKIKSKYTDPQEQQQAIQDFYSKEGFGSMSTGCGALLIQMPVIMGLYGAIYMPLTYILRLNRYGDGLVDTLSTAVEKYVESGRSTRWMEIPVLNHIDELKADLGDKFPDTAYNVLTDFAAHFRAGPFNFGDIPGQVWHDQKMIIIIPILAFADPLPPDERRDVQHGDHGLHADVHALHVPVAVLEFPGRYRYLLGRQLCPEFHPDDRSRQALHT